MIDLYEIRNGQEIKVAECTFKDVAQIGLFRFFRIQELLGRKMKVQYRKETRDEIYRA
jgi:hypothetical protein